MNINKIPLSKLSFIYSVVTALVIALSFSAICAYEYQNYYEKKVKDFEQLFITKNKSLIKSEVTLAVEKMKKTINEEYTSTYKIIEDRVNTAINLFNINKKTQSIDSFYKILDGIVFQTVPSYYFIFDANGNIVYHQENQKMLHKNVFLYEKSSKDFDAIVKKAIEEGSSQGRYNRKDFGTNKLRNLYINIKKIGDSDMYLAASIYLDEIDKELKSSFIKKFDNERFGYDGYGYYWITDDKDTMIFHALDKDMVGKQYTNLQDSNGVYILQEISSLIKKSTEGYLSYMYNIPGKDMSAKKTSFVKSVGHWGWVIGAGFYLEDFTTLINKEKEDLKIIFKKLAFSILTSLAFILSIIFIISWKISKRFKHIEDTQIQSMNLLNQYKMILDKSNIVSKTDKFGKITYVNELFEKVSGYSKKNMIGKTHRVVKDPSTPRETFKSLWSTISQGNTWQGIIKNKKKGRKSSYYCQTTIAPITDEKGEIQEFISVCINVTELIEQKDKLENIFLTDSLTSLGSRMKLLEEISKAVDAQIAFIDIDRFTQINDTFGNAIGDELLREVGKKLYALTNEFDVSSYRMYADVFVVYSQTLEKNKFQAMIEGIIRELTPCTYSGKEDISCSFTTGIAYGSDNILAYADMALQSAKRDKKPFAIYDKNSQLLHEFEDNIVWMKKLGNAVEEERIVPYFQPLYNYKTQKVEKYEALMRYLDADGSVVSPFKFLDIAKKTKVYPTLTKSIVHQAVQYLSNTKDLVFSINLTLEDLLHKEVMEYIYSTLLSYDIFERVVFEIVESEELISFAQVKDILFRFKEKGVKIAVDDFGSGYSNYAYLLELDVDFIKIDGSIIKKLEESQSTRDLVASIVTWAKKSDIETIAEFVSNEAIDKIVKDLHVDFAQGYLYGKPNASIDINIS